MTATLDGRVAIVTGAARGIGLAIAARLLADGARVGLLDIDGAALSTAAASLGRPDDVLEIQADVTKEDQIVAGVDATRARWGRLDILVNNAGIAGPAKPAWEYTEAEWRRVVDIDLLSVFLMCRVVVPHMLEAGSGRIVNIASIAGKEGNPNTSAYSASKAAVIGSPRPSARSSRRGNRGQLRDAGGDQDRHLSQMTPARSSTCCPRSR